MFKKYNPDYIGSEEEWVQDLVYGRLVRFTITFKAQNHPDVVYSVLYGYDLPEIPEVPYVEEHTGEWESFSSINITQNATINAVYTSIYPSTQGLQSTLINGDTEYAVTGIGTATDTDIVISSRYNNKPVTSIGDSAFYNRTNLTSIRIPTSITSAQRNAFFGCNGLTAVYITNIVAWCNIGFVSSSSNPLYYAKNLYLNGSLVKDLIIPYGVQSIGDYAFHDYTELTSISLADSVENIGTSTFTGCTGLTSITIPENIKRIGEWAFSNCTGLTAVYISDMTAWCNIELVSSSSNPLYHAKNLYLNGNLVTDFVIPDSVTSISGYAFYGCTSITSITIHENLASVGDMVFSVCTGLTAVYITDIVEWCNIEFVSSSSNPLYYAKNLYLNGNLVTDLIIPDSVTRIGKRTFENYKTLSSVTIPNTVVSIGDYAFAGCTGLTSIAIPSSVASIEPYAFYGCTGLTGVYITDVASWCNITFGNFFANPLYYAKNLYLNGNLVTTLTIPSDVTSIGAYAFAGCTSLTSIIVPLLVETIGGNSFYGTTNLKIYCETTQKPDGWDSNWNPSNRPVVWGYVA